MWCFLGVLSASQHRTAINWIRGKEALYLRLKSYRDTGFENSSEGKITFETDFVRPGKMYFKYESRQGANYFCAPGAMGIADSAS